MDTDRIISDRRDGVASYRYLIPAFGVWLSSFAMGTCFGYSAPAKASIISEHEFEVTENQFSWLASILTLGGLLGGLTGAHIAERWGRRWTLVMCNIGMMIGWQAIVCATDVKYLFVGRIITGYFTGVASLVGPVYLSEVSPQSIRGRLSSAIQLFIVSGLLAMYIVGSSLEWKWLAIFAMSVSCVTIVVLLFSVESPSWYFQKEKHSSATKALLFLWGDCDQVTAELLRNERTLNTGPIQSEMTTSDNSQDINVVEPIVLAVLLMIAQQGCAINAVVFYAEDIFRKAGTTLSAYTCMVAFGVGQVIGSLVNMLLIDRCGRRVLLISSSIFVFLSLLVMSAYFQWFLSSGCGWVPIVAMSIYTVAFAIGLGPVAWIMMGEMLPTKCRNYGSVLATSVNWFGAFLVTNQWNHMQKELSIAGSYFFFAFVTLVLLIVFIVKLPETKGKSLFEIESYFIRLPPVNVLNVGGGTLDDSVA